MKNPHPALRRAIAQLLTSALLTQLAAPAFAQTAENTTTYEYDAVGNPTRTLDPLGHERRQSYDSLNRLIQQLEPHPTSTTTPSGTQGTINLTVDGQDQTTAVADPRSLNTTYTIDGLGNVTTVVNPDTGTTTNTYDAAGNLLLSTDARGVKTGYTYDELNRITKLTYAKTGVTTETVTITWDTAPNGIGRIAQITDPSGATLYRYDLQGRIVRKEQQASTLTSVVFYGYDAFGRLSQLTYPSGRIVSFVYDTNGQVNKISVDGVVALSNISYAPFGPVTGWTWSNGQTVQRSYDLAGRPKSQTLGQVVRNLKYDPASRITQLDEGTSATTRLYSYDNLDRITSYSTPSTSRAYGYDLNGNLNLLTVGGASTTNTVDTASNRLTATTGPAPASTFTYDAVGNILSDGTRTYAYALRGRLKSATIGTTTMQYSTNGLGQRVFKKGTGISGIPTYLYDEQGHLIGDYDGNGNVAREIVWLGDTPVLALAKPTQEVIVDNATTGTTFTGTWTAAITLAGYYSKNYHSHTAGAGTESATWALSIPAAQSYRVYARWVAQPTNSPTATYAITSQSGTANVSVNQQDGGGQWAYLGTYPFAPGAGNKISLTQKADGIVIADAVKLVPDTVTSTNALTYYIDADHLNTPRVIRDNQNRIVWSWDSDPYGAAQPNENPSGLGTFSFNLRFPGQYYDKETNLAYNYYRDGYDPVTARYVQSDPIGLKGGSWSTYGYVNGRPLAFTDPRGLECTAQNGKVTCNVPGGPQISFPQPPMWPSVINSASESYHYYNIAVPLNGANAACAMAGIINSPTPGSPSPATPGGTLNNATPPTAQSIFNGIDLFTSFGNDPGGYNNSPVKSYVLNNGAVVVNVTLPGHPLFPGYVARIVSGSQVNNFGEGLGSLQASYSPFAGQINGVWVGQTQGILNACGCPAK